MIKSKFQKIKTSLSIDKNIKSRIVGWGSVTAFLLALIGMNTVPLIASAFGQVTTRSIEISSSVVSATSVSYLVTFNPATAGTLGGIDLDFCTDPIIGDSCTVPTGFTTTASPTLLAAPSGFSTSTGSWGVTVNAGHNLVYLTNATAQTETGISTAISFTIQGITNPSTLGSFYARILTWDTQAHANAYTSGGTPGAGIVDAGGIALSTTAQITITSKVQESITFCVYTSTYDSGACTGTGNAVTLGNGNGILSTIGSYTDLSTKYDIQTNALHNVTIRFTGAPLTSGSNIIENSTLSGTGSTAATAYASTAGTAQFGLYTYEATGTTITPASTYSGTGPTACNTAASGYNLASTAIFGFNIASAASTYGDTLATVTPGATAEGIVGFLGNISNSTPAGVYTSTLTFIATGAY